MTKLKVHKKPLLTVTMSKTNWGGSVKEEVVVDDDGDDDDGGTGGEAGVDVKTAFPNTVLVAVMTI
jgi:hypothetical protein